MRRLFGSLFKMIITFVVLVAILLLVGKNFRQYTLPVERFMQPKVDKLLVMVNLKEAPLVGLPADTLTAFQELQTEISTRKTELDSLITALKAKENLVIAQGDSVDRLRQDLLVQQTELTQQEDENFTSIAKLFEAMKPEQAAQILLEMSDQNVIEILSRMGDREAGKLMEALGDPVRAADIIDRYTRLQKIIKNEN